MKDSKGNTDFIDLYLKYTEHTEAPTFFHRWTAITMLGAFLGRNIYFQHGHFTLHPNLYVMLIGSPGTKKSSAIKMGTKLLKQAGYNTFAAKKTRQEKFLLDLADNSAKKEAQANPSSAFTTKEDMILDSNLWGDGSIEESDSYSSRAPAEIFVAADEFNNFIGLNNMDFISILGELWDYEGVFDYKLKNSDDIFIPHPTVSILGGNTATGFAQAFSVDSIGQGFFSRLLLVHSVPSGVKYTFPPEPDLELQKKLLEVLARIKTEVVGKLTMTEEAKVLLDKLYKTWDGIDDSRFEHYTNRRLTHLLKLCLVITASKCEVVITEAHVIEANTILTFTEQLMPKALGEFGKAKNSAIAHKIVTAIDNTRMPISTSELWKIVSTDLDSRPQLAEIISNLLAAEKIQAVGAQGFLPIKKVLPEGKEIGLDWSLLTTKERETL